MSNQDTRPRHYVDATLLLHETVANRYTLQFVGNDGYIMTHEAFLYGFDAALMFSAMVTMNLIHPGDVAMYLRKMQTGDEKHEYQMVDTQYGGV